MSIESPTSIEKAEGKLGVLMPGLGAVSTTVSYTHLRAHETP